MRNENEVWVAVVDGGWRLQFGERPVGGALEDSLMELHFLLIWLF